MLRNCLQKQVIEGKIEGKRKVTGKRRRRRRKRRRRRRRRRKRRKHKQLLDEIKETRAFWNLKDEAPVRTLWRTRFGRSYGTVAKQIIEGVNE
jgi:hypothetical protein